LSFEVRRQAARDGVRCRQLSMEVCDQTSPKQTVATVSNGSMAEVAILVSVSTRCLKEPG